MKQKILITGAAGFVGFHLTKKLLTYGHDILGIDNLNEVQKFKPFITRLEKNDFDGILD